jgi:hypothetical protein
MPLDYTSSRKNLTETELRMVAEVAIEMARAIGGPFSVHAGALTFARAALKDTEFKAALAALHRNIMVRQANDPRGMLAPLAPMFRNLEQAAQKVLSAARP